MVQIAGKYQFTEGEIAGTSPPSDTTLEIKVNGNEYTFTVTSSTNNFSNVFVDGKEVDCNFMGKMVKGTLKVSGDTITGVETHQDGTVLHKTLKFSADGLVEVIKEGNSLYGSLNFRRL